MREKNPENDGGGEGGCRHICFIVLFDVFPKFSSWLVAEIVEWLVVDDMKGFLVDEVGCMVDVMVWFIIDMVWFHISRGRYKIIPLVVGPKRGKGHSIVE